MYVLNTTPKSKKHLIQMETWPSSTRVESSLMICINSLNDDLINLKEIIIKNLRVICNIIHKAIRYAIGN